MLALAVGRECSWLGKVTVELALRSALQIEVEDGLRGNVDVVAFGRVLEGCFDIR